MACKLIRRLTITLAGALALIACATSPTGRSQLELFSPAQMARMGEQAYQQVREKTPPSRHTAVNRYVECVTIQLTGVVPRPVDGGRWEITVFEDEAINAFALPGGHIGVYMGLLRVAGSQDRLAAVIGHEMAHVQAQHANARLSAQYATDMGLQLIAALAGGSSPASSDRVMALLGLGAQVGILLPYGRAQESEADVLGLRYMARAGFDPRASVELWRNMQLEEKLRPPEFLSTHPASENRIRELQGRMPQALDLYRQAQIQGRRPDCRRP